MYVPQWKYVGSHRRRSGAVLVLIRGPRYVSSIAEKYSAAGRARERIERTTARACVRTHAYTHVQREKAGGEWCSASESPPVWSPRERTRVGSLHGGRAVIGHVKLHRFITTGRKARRDTAETLFHPRTKPLLRGACSRNTSTCDDDASSPRAPPPRPSPGIILVTDATATVTHTYRSHRPTRRRRAIAIAISRKRIRNRSGRAPSRRIADLFKRRGSVAKFRPAKL